MPISTSTPIIGRDGKTGYIFKTGEKFKSPHEIQFYPQKEPFGKKNRSVCIQTYHEALTPKNMTCCIRLAPSFQKYILP